MKANYLGQAWLVLLLALAFGGVLAGMHIALKPRIDANKEAEAAERIPDLVPGAVGGEKRQVAGLDVYKALDAEGRHVGWVVKAAGNGFADVIELLIGLDADASTITGLYVLDQKETPELGSKITEPDFTGRFDGKSARKPVVAVKADPAPDSNQILAVTAATISSDSVCAIVNTALNQVRPELIAANRPEPERPGDRSPTAATSDRPTADPSRETGPAAPSLPGGLARAVPGAAASRKRSVAGLTVYEALNSDGRRIGWGIVSDGRGYKSRIRVMIGLDGKADRLTGLAVLEQNETAGYGTRIVEESFRRRFAGQPADAKLKVARDASESDPGRIQAITRATVSSRAVCGIVNRALAKARDELRNLPE